MKEIKAIIQPFVLDAVINALKQIPGLPGITVSEVKGFGRSRAEDAAEKIVEGLTEYARKVKLEVVVPEELLEWTIQAIHANAHRGQPGDGKIFISTIDDVMKIRTGERGEQAI
jgi:nitrogen regulatory protein P-II 1